MYFYTVGYYSMEECPSITLCSDKLYTESQFKDLVVDVTKEAYEFDKSFDGFQYLYDKVAKILIDKYGFKNIVITASFNPFGWASIIDNDDWKDETKYDEDIKLLRKKLIN